MAIFKHLFVAVVAFFVLSTLVFAQGEVQTLPDNPLYQVKRQIETAGLNAGLDPLQRAGLYTEYAHERVAELTAMVSKGKPEFAGDLAADYEKAIGGALEEIDRAKAQGRDVSEALEAVEESTRKHTEVLTGLLEKVPAQAKPAITRAIEASKQGRNRALDVLNKIQTGELPIGKPESVGKPEDIGKPEGVGKPERVGKPQETGKPPAIPGGRGR